MSQSCITPSIEHGEDRVPVYRITPHRARVSAQRAGVLAHVKDGRSRIGSRMGYQVTRQVIGDTRWSWQAAAAVCRERRSLAVEMSTNKVFGEEEYWHTSPLGLT